MNLNPQESKNGLNPNYYFIFGLRETCDVTQLYETHRIPADPSLRDRIAEL